MINIAINSKKILLDCNIIFNESIHVILVVNATPEKYIFPGLEIFVFCLLNTFTTRRKYRTEHWVLARA